MQPTGTLVHYAAQLSLDLCTHTSVSTCPDVSKVRLDEVTTGTCLVMSAGKSHSCDRPTSRCPPPISASTSVAEGCSETTRSKRAFSHLTMREEIRHMPLIVFSCSTEVISSLHHQYLKVFCDPPLNLEFFRGTNKMGGRVAEGRRQVQQFYIRTHGVCVIFKTNTAQKKK
jgi:hypothetical protein